MRVFAQLISLWLGLTAAFPGTNKEINSSSRGQEETGSSSTTSNRALKKVFLSNRTITCNDGSQAGFYLRKSQSSRKWVIFLEGGWYCYDHHSCRNRWVRQRHYMTSSKWPETRDVGGILSGSMAENPFWWNANHVFIPYCTSDSWSGSKPFSESEMFSFMGAAVVQQVVKDVVPLGLENSTDLLLTGSSAGGTGVMINLDPVRELLHDTLGLKHIAVRGVSDSGWFLDRTPYAPTLKPAVEAIRKGMEMWRGQVPKRCREEYAAEPWRCYFGYRLYPTLKTELFVFQWLFDEAQMDADNVGAPVTKQQWDYIHKMGDALRQSFENVSAVFAPSCISHSVLTKRDWQNVKIDDISIAEALHCWEQKINRKRRLKNKKLHQLRMYQQSSHQNKTLLRYNNNNNSNNKHQRLASRNVTVGVSDGASLENMRPVRKRRRRKHRKHKKGKQKDGVHELNTNGGNRTSPSSSSPITSNTLSSQRSGLQNGGKGGRRRRCTHRRLERCSWPQCNHSCPRLHNPFTGEEMDFIELLKSFGLDMESVAKALGIDMQTLNNMDHSELLNLLTQQSN